MNADSHKLREVFSDELTDLDDNLGATNNDVRLLAELQTRIGGLLKGDNGIEQVIRAVLQERFDDGDLRKETYQLVMSLLDKQTGKAAGARPQNPDIDEFYEVDARTASLDDREDERSDVVLDDYSSTAVLDKNDIDLPASTPPAAAPDKVPPHPPQEPQHSRTAVIPDEELRPATADDQVQVGSVLRDRFLLKERVSGGSMGVVYKALDRRMAEAGSKEPWVAIKVLSPQLAKNGQALRALQQEAAKGRSMAHPNIVRFIDMDRDDDLYFIVMEWLEGKTLATILDSAEGKVMPANEAIRVVEQMASALEYAHRCGIVHADVKPGNIMILPNGDAKLFDFGVARVQQTQKNSPDDFNPAVLGALTPAYSSMQVLTGDEPAPADDVFSLGCLFYRLVAGYRVFGPRNAAEAAEEGMKPTRPQGLSDGQWRTLKKALSFARITRFQSMAEFLDALRDEEPAPPPIMIDDDERMTLDDPPASRSWIVGLVALLLLISFAVYQFGFSDKYGWTENARAWLDDQLSAITSDAPGSQPPATAAEDGIVDLPAPVIEDIAETGDEPGSVSDELDGQASTTENATSDDAPQAIDEADAGSLADSAGDGDTAMPGGAAGTSPMPPADVEIPLLESTTEREPVIVRLREDSGSLALDLVRSRSVHLPLQIRIEEVAYSGNRSPWASGQYSLSTEEIIDIPAGQERTRINLSMASDPLREADQVSTLRIRNAESTTTELATIELVLEDDDQRVFESELPTNTMAFSVSQVSVRERDPVVQIDVLRFNPDDTQIVVNYTVSDITATEGEDYFSPGGYSVSFGPGQRSARLLIPLVQDTIKEGDEAFTVELAPQDSDAETNVFKRIIVMIRDDEIAGL